MKAVLEALEALLGVVREVERACERAKDELGDNGHGRGGLCDSRGVPPNHSQRRPVRPAAPEA